MTLRLARIALALACLQLEWLSIVEMAIALGIQYHLVLVNILNTPISVQYVH